MASFSPIKLKLLLILLFMTSRALSSQESSSLQFSSISAAPSFLPSSPMTSMPFAPSLPPDIAPLFPTPKAMAPSPADGSSMPTIPSSLSPPNPDDILAPGPGAALPPSAALPASSSAFLSSCRALSLAVFLALMVFSTVQLFGV